MLSGLARVIDEMTELLGYSKDNVRRWTWISRYSTCSNRRSYSTMDLMPPFIPRKGSERGVGFFFRSSGLWTEPNFGEQHEDLKPCTGRLHCFPSRKRSAKIDAVAACSIIARHPRFAVMVPGKQWDYVRCSVPRLPMPRDHRISTVIIDKAKEII